MERTAGVGMFGGSTQQSFLRSRANSIEGGTTEVMKNILLQVVDNPVNALANANYIGILAWAIALGVILRHASDTTKALMSDLEVAITVIVKTVIRFAPLGIFGIVASTIARTGFGTLVGYANLLALLIGCIKAVDVPRDEAERLSGEHLPRAAGGPGGAGGGGGGRGGD